PCAPGSPSGPGAPFPVTPPHSSPVTYDIAIVGGGIVGLATAYRLQEARPGVRVAVLEKEGALARHQTGRNSGVLHAGVYYRPGSAKGRLCRAGTGAMGAGWGGAGVAWRCRG